MLFIVLENFFKFLKVFKNFQIFYVYIVKFVKDFLFNFSCSELSTLILLFLNLQFLIQITSQASFVFQ